MGFLRSSAGLGVSVSVLLLSAGCGGGSDAVPEVAKGPAPSAVSPAKPTDKATPVEAVASENNDGVIAIGVVGDYIDKFRDGNGEVVCTLVSEDLSKALVSNAAAAGLAKPDGSCEKAVKALLKGGRGPAAATDFVVTDATDTTTELDVTFETGSILHVSLIEKDRTWLIDTVTVA